MRRRQVANLLISLAGETRSREARNQLLDVLYQLPTDCFIADDWHVILHQVTKTLLQQEEKNRARMPTHLNRLLSQIQLRLKMDTH
jgi:hypothetical protein